VDNFSRLLLAWRGWGVLGAALEALPAKPHAWSRSPSVAELQKSYQRAK
jgi:hypothetical protein